MPDCISGIPYARGACTWPHQVAVNPPVSQNVDGSIKAGEISGVRATGQPVAAHFGSTYDWAAMESAWAMVEEHDQRIRDAGQIPDMGILLRKALWIDYFNVSIKQFRDDDAKLATGKPLQLIFSADSVPTFSPDRLAERAFSKALGLEKTTEDRIYEELVAFYGKSRALIDISRTLPLDPATLSILQAQIDAAIPPEEIPGPAPLPDTFTVVTGSAPAPQLGQITNPGLRDPSLPPSPSNTLSADERLAREARAASAIVSDAPEYYRGDAQADSKASAELRDFFYWKANYPSVRLVAAQNPGLRPEELNTPWPGPGLAPLVAVEFTPRQRPLPEKSFLAANTWLGTIVGVVALAIPVVGPILSAGLNYATNKELQKWAQSWQPNRDDFAPQYYPQPFQVPLPLDRAQIIVRQPWYGPAMVDQFAEEIRVNKLRQASDAYAALMAAGTTALTALPSIGSAKEGTSSGGAPPAQGGAQLGTITSSTHAPGGALPILAAGILLVMGAPIVVPIGVLVLLGGKKK